MKTPLMSLLEVVKSANDFLDTEPNFVAPRDNNDDVSCYVPNPNSNTRSYTNLIDMFVYFRYARFKVRDPILEVEYDLCLIPWSNSFHFNVWIDGSTHKIDTSSNQAVRMKYLLTEEEYFQESTVRDLFFINLSTIIEVKKLQNRIFDYFGIIPCEAD